MNPELMSILEKVKIGDLKSAMDQLHFLCSEISILKENVNAIYEDLDTKVDLASAMQNGSTVVTRIGTGIIASTSDSGATLNGTGTLFTKETQVGNEIRIGAETTYITAVTSDVIITVSPALTGTYTNVIFAIIKNATKEVLTGDFNFGILNGDIFNGTVISGSTFQMFGRMTQPNDIVNVQFVQKAVYPAMVRAQNSILRVGDTINGPTNTSGSGTVFDNNYTYKFTNCNWTFDTGIISFGDTTNAYTQLFYYGPTTNTNHVATVGYVSDIKSELMDNCYANWTFASDSGSHNLITPSGQSVAVRTRFKPGISPDLYSSNFSDYFSLTSQGICLNDSLSIPTGYGVLVSISGSATWIDYTYGHKHFANCVIYKNGSLLSEGYTNIDFANADYGDAQPGSSASVTIGLVKGDYLVIGALSTNNFINSDILPTTQDTYQSLSIAKIGFYPL
jgi:hypothetical protein